MSDAIALEVQARDILGKTAKKLRADGLVPAVVHNHGKESTHVQVEYQTLVKVIHRAGRHNPIELTIDGKKSMVLIKSITRDPKLGSVTHVVFNSVRANQKVEASVPVAPRYAEGNEATPAERAGLIVLAQLDEVEVKAVPAKLPNGLYYDAEKLVEVGDQITAAEIELPDGVELVTDPEHVLATVFEPGALAAANEAAAGDAEEAAPAAEAEAPAEVEANKE